MISFSGDFSQKTKRFMLNNESKANALASLVVFVITLIALVVVGYYWDWIVLWFIIAPILMLVFSYTSYRNPTQDVLDLIIPTSIVIDGEEIVSVGKKFNLKRNLSQVKKVIDYGEWYYLVFYYEHRCMRFVCQKDLIKEGTIEQFEKLFEDKLEMKFKHNYGSELLNSAYEKYFKGEYITYEEFVIMLSTNDELYFMYDEKEYQIEHTDIGIVHMCVSRYENNKVILERNEKFNSIIELLDNFKIAGKSIHEIWPNVYFTKSK